MGCRNAIEHTEQTTTRQADKRGFIDPVEIKRKDYHASHLYVRTILNTRPRHTNLGYI